MIIENIQIVLTSEILKYIMKKIISIIGTIYLLVNQKRIDIKEAFRTSGVLLNAAKTAEKLDPTKGKFNVIKQYIGILKNHQ